MSGSEKTRLKRLDSSSDVVFNRILTGAFVIFLWLLPWLSSKSRDSSPPLYYPLVAVASIVSLSWLRRMRQVSFDGEKFVIKDWFSQPVEVPKSHLVKARAIPMGRGLSWITLKFNPPTKYGAAVRVMTGESANTDKFLRMADKMKAIAERRPAVEPKLALNDKAIEVRGWSKEETEKIVGDFGDLYSLPDSSIAISDPKDGLIVLRFPSDLKSDHFVFLVNYLHYPEHQDLHGRSPSARGRCTLTADFQLPEADLVGRHAIFFVPPNDNEYDLVLAKLDSGETYRIPFTNLRWKLDANA